MARRRRNKSSLKKLLQAKRVIKPKLLCTFTRQLATMLDAGLPVIFSLRTLSEQCQGSYRMRGPRDVLEQIVSEVEAGTPFSECLAHHPQSFSKLYVNMVRAGEASGAVVQVLQRLADYMERMQRFKRKVIASLIYPSVVMTVAVSVTLMLLMFVVPQFVEIFADLLEGQDLPKLTAWVMALSNTLVNCFGYLVLGVFVAAIAFWRFRKWRKGKYITDMIMIKAPPFSSLVLKSNVAQFCSTLSTLMDAGVPVLESVRIVYEICGNDVMRGTIQMVYESVNEGEGFARPLEATKLFPIMVVRFIEIGEKTGQLPTMLTRIAAQYEEEVDTALEALVSLIEPLLIVFLAVMVGTIVIALFMPIVTIIDALGI